MVVPVDVASAAQRGDLAIVQSWLNNAGPDAVNDVCGSGNTCLMRSMASIGRVHERIEVLRFLISRGANVNVCDQTNWTPLHYACFQRTGSPEMVSLILHAGGSAGSVLEARTPLIGHSMYPDSTALGILLHSFGSGLRPIFRGRDREVILKALLRAGASLHNCSGGKPAEGIMQDHLTNDSTLANEHFIRCREILAGVREHGSYKRYLRAPHRQFVRLCSLLVRRREERTNRLLLERLRTEESPWSSLGSIPVWKSAELHLLQRIARLPNGPCWNVLSYWREAE